MFGNVIYYDKKKIDEYKSVIRGQKDLEVAEYEVSNDKGVQVDLKAFGADAKASKTYKAKVQESFIIKFDGYVKIPEEFDFTQMIDKFKPMIVASVVDDTIWINQSRRQ